MSIVCYNKYKPIVFVHINRPFCLVVFVAISVVPSLIAAESGDIPRNVLPAGTFLFVFGDNSVIIHLKAAMVFLLLTSDRKSSHC